MLFLALNTQKSHDNFVIIGMNNVFVPPADTRKPWPMRNDACYLSVSTIKLAKFQLGKWNDKRIARLTRVYISGSP